MFRTWWLSRSWPEKSWVASWECL